MRPETERDEASGREMSGGSGRTTPEPLEPPADVPSPGTEAGVLTTQVKQALTALCPEHRRVIIDLAYQRRTLHEVATSLGMSTDAVKKQVFYAMRSLKLILEELGLTPHLGGQQERGTHAEPTGRDRSERGAAGRPTLRLIRPPGAPRGLEA